MEKGLPSSSAERRRLIERLQQEEDRAQNMHDEEEDAGPSTRVVGHMTVKVFMSRHAVSLPPLPCFSVLVCREYIPFAILTLLQVLPQ